MRAKLLRWAALIGAAALLVVAGVMWGRSSPKATAARLVGTSEAAAQVAAPAVDTGEALIAPVSDATPATKEAKRFKRYDKDASGFVGGDEYFANRRKSFAKLDVNGDGRLSFEEYSVKAIAKFNGADADKDGKLAVAEFATTAVKRKLRNKPVCPPGVAAAPAVEEVESST